MTVHSESLVEHRDVVPQLLVVLLASLLQCMLSQRVRQNQHAVRTLLDESTLRCLDAGRGVVPAIASSSDHAGVRHRVVLCVLLNDIAGMARNNHHRIARVAEAERPVAGRVDIRIALHRRYESIVVQVAN